MFSYFSIFLFGGYDQLDQVYTLPLAFISFGKYEKSYIAQLPQT